MVANSLGVYHTGTVNAASHTVGTTFTANATLVNAAALNVVNQINTATFYATTSSNLAGAAVYANSTGLWTTGTVNAAAHTIGTSFVANTTTLSSAANLSISTISAGSQGATLTSNATTAQLTIGNSSVNATMNGTSFSGTASNSTNLNGQPASYYTNATNISTGTLPDIVLNGVYSNVGIKTDNTLTVFLASGSGSTNTRRDVLNLVSYKGNSSTTTGAIVFTAPTTDVAIMHRFNIEGMIYAGGPTLHTIVQGYRSSGTVGWTHTSKINLGVTDVQVRWAVDAAGKQCIILGDVGTVWSWPHITISRAMFSYSGTTDAYCQGWTASLVTSLTGYTDGVSPGAGSPVTVTNTTVNTTVNDSDNLGGVSAASYALLSGAAFTGAVSGITTLGTGNTTVTGFANVSTTLQVTGTTTLASNLAVDTNVLLVDTVTNRIGINKTAPAVALDVVGAANVSSTFQVNGITTFGANTDHNYQHLLQPTIKSYREAVNTTTASAGTVTLDLSQGNIFKVNLTSDITTINITNAATAANSTTAYSATVVFIQDATGRSIASSAWPASVLWPGAAAVGTTAAPSTVDVFQLMTVDGGTTFYGAVSLSNLS